MSSPTEPLRPGRAETAFRDAFDRLKKGKPSLLPKGTRVTQNNVAREAGLDPSALKKARFPSLIEEIQRWVDEHGDQISKSPSQSLYAHRNRNRSLREQIEALKMQRDNALALLVDADARILALTMENQRLQLTKPKDNVTSLNKGKKGS
ncbi:hypothetical protein A264_04202 [Pseudomonas syringae pv. actinidiae ICMP 19071]|uniref:hypothetical protein n=1 Tax=Pseudomonas syringae TaxID=317 RepID=UPI000357433B|nr:hypothetical protein [Pseudomonas syringae]EPM62154.1 hypothetical protein A264_04202 [Pseudomonas syringae pv. actinidiae ICMP 19071]EPM79897.1 hypothetical protein A3SO_04216 [Pseudomonas syringae pv. actinidiae ICMP 19072]OSN69064.1 hypothetical protein BV349_00702 [Pseudomonas syringae pv. actinidiae]OSN79257.1 hypothetical protein BV351_00701 [Pseudomonas syringae pv. actinidiae]RMS15449.1 hypothetical protein ALP75_202101 [Pseudomonas syringae pv. actinidiae]